MTPEELEMQTPYAALEKGIHDIYSGDPWANPVCNVKNELPKLLTDPRLLHEVNKEHVIPNQKQLSSRLFLCKYKRTIRNPEIPLLFKGLTFEGANQAVRAVINSVPLTGRLRQTAMTNAVLLNFFARWLGAPQPS